jgi:hypothetical protein
MKTTIQGRFVLLLCFIQMTLVCANAQIRTVTQRPYPTEANSVAWITNVPYISGAGVQQQLDLFVPTNRKNIPLIVYIHGGGYGHGDKIGDSLNPGLNRDRVRADKFRFKTRISVLEQHGYDLTKILSEFVKCSTRRMRPGPARNIAYKKPRLMIALNNRREIPHAPHFLCRDKSHDLRRINCATMALDVAAADVYVNVEGAG